MANGGDVIIHVNIDGSRTVAQAAHPVGDDADASPRGPIPTETIAGGATVAGSTPIDTLQGRVSDEEAYNSYIGQRGRFTVNPQSGPDEWTYATTYGAFAFHDPVHGLQIGGDAVYGANIPADLRRYLSCNRPLRLFSTEKDFAALVPVGDSNRLMLWGAGIKPDNAIYSLCGIRSVYANRHAFAFIYEESDAEGHRIGAIGNDAMGGRIPDDVHLKLASDAPESIRATEGAFVVLTRSGRVYAWGDGNNGGAIPATASAVLTRMNVRKIFATAQAFCAVDEYGEPAVWGNAQAGGTLPAATMEAILDDEGIDTVIAAQSAFCCITKRRRKAIAWGDAGSGGTMHASAASFALTGDIVACKASAWAFCAINRSGRAEAWGLAGHGGTLAPRSEYGIRDATEEATTPQAEVAQVLEGAIGGASPMADWAGSSFVTAEWSAGLYAVDSGFCLITTTADDRIRSVTTWGASDTLPSQIVRQVLLGSHLEYLVTSNRAYLAVVRQGAVDGRTVAWGETAANGGSLPEDVLTAMASGIVEVHAIKRMPVSTSTPPTNTSGFIARCANGAVVVWGRAAGKHLLPPEA